MLTTGRDGPDIARVAALVGDPARANMLTALMTGKALTASELAREAGVTPATASSHLAKLEAAKLVRASKSGRHRYVSLASEQVAAMLEALMGVAAETGQLRHRPGPRDAALRHARVCYNHLAGSMGVRLHDALAARGLIEGDHAAVNVTPEGAAFFRDFGIDMAALDKARGPVCRPCLDWSERTQHLGGRLGRAVLAQCEQRKWLRRDGGSRAILFTPPGERAFAETFLRA